MRLEIKEDADVSIVTLYEPRLDVSVAVDFKAKMRDWIEAGHEKIALDLSHVDYVDSSGLSSLVSVLKRLASTSKLVLFEVREPVMRLFKLTRMDRIFVIEQDQASALVSSRD
ncbi:MAG: anti-sigma B factor antagonist [Pseudohongiellaceae bacterium]|jgi:anti-sigma B factor antagonist